MAKRSRGPRSKTRKKLRQIPGYKPAITKFLQEFKERQKVIILIETSSHRGVPHPRFKGKIGEIVGKRGRSYIVEIKDGEKVKKIISRPEHLKVI